MTNQQEHPQAQCHLLSFPFWLFVDRRQRLPYGELEYRQSQIRVYPPFRSAPSNFLPMPPIHAGRIPHRNEAGPLFDHDDYISPLAAIPVPPEDPEDPSGWSAFLSFADDKDGPPNRYFPMDSLRLDIWEAGDVVSWVSEFIHELLEQLRFHTGQWWIGRSMAPFYSYQRAAVGITVNGRRVGPLDRLTSFRTWRGDEAALTSETWKNAIDAVEEERRPPGYRLQLLDARYFAATDEIRRSVLDSAIACEDAIRITFERLWPSNGAAFKAGRVMQGSGLPDYLDSDVKRVVRRSYREEHPERYGTIKNLWDTRGNLAHGQRAVFRDNGRVIDVDSDRAEEFEMAVEHCVDWLEELG